MDMHKIFFSYLVLLPYSCAFIADTLVTQQKSSPNIKNVCQLPENQKISVSGGCDFNNGTCAYEFPAELWRQHAESAGAIMFGKNNDDSKGVEQRYALFLTTDGKIPLNTTSDIITTTVGATNVCLKFWYLMPNENSELQVYVTEGLQSPRLVWETHHQMSQQWKKVEIPVNANSQFIVSFTSTKENNFGYVGLDSISFDAEKPPTTTSTTTVPTTLLSSTMRSLLNLTTVAAPVTSGNTNLSLFLTTATLLNRANVSYSANKSRQLDTTTDIKVTSAAGISSKATGPIKTTQAVDKDNKTTFCNCSCPTVSADSTCITTTPSMNIPTNIDIVTPLQGCNTGTEKKLDLPGNCDFSSDACGYAIPSYPHLWELTSHRYIHGGSDVGEITGDHSVDSYGGYMVFNTNNKHVQIGVSAEIISPPMYTNNTTCMEFWYIMPNNVAALDIFVVDEGGNRALMWTRTGPTNGWSRAHIEIAYNGKFQVALSSKKSAANGFLGIDDIAFFTDHGSSRRSFTVAPTSNQLSQQTAKQGNNSLCSCVCPTPTITKLCPDRPPARDALCKSNSIITNASCDFDDGPCSFIIPMYPHLWEMTRYYYGDSSRGIIEGDHTTVSGDQRGNYAVFDTGNTHTRIGVQQGMVSDVIKANISVCITFWYNMPTNKATLDIYKKATNKTYPNELLWKQSFSATKGWEEASIVFHSNTSFQIVFSSTKTDRDSYVGVDDIVVHYSDF